MDAVKYIEERERMCGTFRNCDGCPIWKSCDPTAEDAKDVVAAVEKWSREHPVVTNGQKIVELMTGERCIERTPYCVSIHVNADWWDAEYEEESND